jgi:hypothetical protein
MGWSGGSYSKGNAGTGGWAGDASAGIGIEAGRHDTQDNDFATGINQCINKDGSNSATANLNLGGFRFTNAGTATGRTDLAQVAQVQDGDYIWLGTTGGTATAMTATAAPAIPAYKTGQKFRMKIGTGLSSTGATPTSHTLNINALGAKDIASNDGSNASPTLGTWVAGSIIELVYGGTYFHIINDPSAWLTYTPTFTPNGGSLSSLNIVRAGYKKTGKTIHLNIYATFDTTGVGTNINVSVPVNIQPTATTFYAISMMYSGSLKTGYITNNSAAVLANYVDLASGTWGTNTSSAVYINTTFEAV